MRSKSLPSGKVWRPYNRSFYIGQIEYAIEALKLARMRLADFDEPIAPQTLKKIRSAIKSAEGALRHAHRIEGPAERGEDNRPEGAWS